MCVCQASDVDITTNGKAWAGITKSLGNALHRLPNRRLYKFEYKTVWQSDLCDPILGDLGMVLVCSPDVKVAEHEIVALASLDAEL